MECYRPKLNGLLGARIYTRTYIRTHMPTNDSDVWGRNGISHRSNGGTHTRRTYILARARSRVYLYRRAFSVRVSMATSAATAGPFAGTEAIGKVQTLPSSDRVRACVRVRVRVCVTAQPTRTHTHTPSNYLAYVRRVYATARNVARGQNSISKPP